MFTSPVRMTDGCGHNFCHDCLVKFTGGLVLLHWFCPECRSKQTKRPGYLMRNRLAEKGVASYNAANKKEKSKNPCSRHSLELTLCKSDLKLCPIFYDCNSLK